MILGIDYRYRNDLLDKYDTAPIELMDETFHGVIVRYKKIKAKPDKGLMRIQFEYEILSTGQNFRKKKALKNNKKFHDTLGKVLHSILEILAEAPDENRNSNTEEFVEKF